MRSPLTLAAAPAAAADNRAAPASRAACALQGARWSSNRKEVKVEAVPAGSSPAEREASEHSGGGSAAG